MRSSSFQKAIIIVRSLLSPTDLMGHTLSIWNWQHSCSLKQLLSYFDEFHTTGTIWLFHPWVSLKILAVYPFILLCTTSNWQTRTSFELPNKKKKSCVRIYKISSKAWAELKCYQNFVPIASSKYFCFPWLSFSITDGHSDFPLLCCRNRIA